MKKLWILYSVMAASGVALLAQENIVESKLEALKTFQAVSKNVVVDYNPFANERTMESMKKGDMNHLEEVQAFNLLSILNQKAFISGKWYSVGDKIDGGKIVAIHPTTVRIKKGSNVSTLALEKSKNLLHVKDSQK